MSTKMYNKLMDTDTKTEEETAMKRRKKSAIDDYKQEETKQLVLPQKKRVLPNTDSSSPAKKTVKSSQLLNQTEDPVDDETLIRETEAALKSLSGSWPGPRGSSYNRGMPEHDESPTFENLFEEKKVNPKLSPSSSISSSGSNDNSCSLKDVITLRDQHAEEKSVKHEGKIRSRAKTSNEFENLLKIENECATIQSQTDPKLGKKDKKGDGSQYQPPDFNELVDDSSNELEIDMSEQGDKDEEDERKVLKKKDDEIKKERYSSEKSINQRSYAPYTQHPTAGANTPTFSATSAFKPPVDSKQSRNPGIGISGSIPPLGPFPAEATFVGYPTPVQETPTTDAPSTLPEDKLRNTSLLQLKGIAKDPAEPRANSVPVKPSPVSIGSPETNSKQYTILQPAAAGSRAASAIQDIAREGVQVVSAVTNSTPSSSASTDASPSKMMTSNTSFDRPTGTLSPTSMNRGRICMFKYNF